MSMPVIHDVEYIRKFIGKVSSMSSLSQQELNYLKYELFLLTLEEIAHGVADPAGLAVETLKIKEL